MGRGNGYVKEYNDEYQSKSVRRNGNNKGAAKAMDTMRRERRITKRLQRERNDLDKACAEVDKRWHNYDVDVKVKRNKRTKVARGQLIVKPNASQWLTDLTMMDNVNLMSYPKRQRYFKRVKDIVDDQYTDTAIYAVAVVAMGNLAISLAR